MATTKASSVNVFQLCLLTSHVALWWKGIFNLLPLKVLFPGLGFLYANLIWVFHFEKKDPFLSLSLFCFLESEGVKLKALKERINGGLQSR